jgi:phosphate-selective porin OprO/OprP
MRTLPAIVLALAAFASAAAAESPADLSLAQEVGRYLSETSIAQDDPSKLSAKWGDGIKLENSDKSFVFHIGGRAMFDVYFKNADDELAPTSGTDDSQQDGTRFRRVRFQMDGTIYKNFQFSVEVEFAASSPELRDTWMQLKSVPFLQFVRAGHFKEPQGLEELTSSRYISMMERPTAIQAFVAAFNSGFMTFGTAQGESLKDRIGWALGVFKDSTPESGGAQKNEDARYAVVVRVTGLPVDNKDDQFLIHVGFSLSYRDQSGNSRTFSARPGVSTGRSFVTVTVPNIDSLLVFGFEIGGAWKALHFQIEGILAEVEGNEAATAEPSFEGWYVQVGYFITGEHRPYSRSSGKWDRVKPKRNFHDGSGGWGAVEAVLRYETLDLNDEDEGVLGGEYDYVLILGFNWYWNPNVRLMFNFIMSDVSLASGASGDFSAFSMRTQIDF